MGTGLKFWSGTKACVESGYIRTGLEFDFMDANLMPGVTGAFLEACSSGSSLETDSAGFSLETRSLGLIWILGPQVLVWHWGSPEA